MTFPLIHFHSLKFSTIPNCYLQFPLKMISTMLPNLIETTNEKVFILMSYINPKLKKFVKVTFRKRVSLNLSWK